MFGLKKRSLSIGFGLVLMTILALGSASVAFADGPNPGFDLNAGTLGESFGTVTFVSGTTLTGADQVAVYHFPITVTDATGSGAGWNLTITSTPFVGNGSDAFANDASTITGVTAATVSGTDIASTSNPSYTSFALPAASTAPTAVKFFEADASSGIGTFTVTPTVDVAIPATFLLHPTGSNNYELFTSTVTVAIVSAP